LPLPVRVLVADDDPEMRAVLADVVKSDNSMQLVGLAEDANEAIAMVRNHAPDVVLLDVKMPGGGGGVAARQIHLLAPNVSIVALTAHEDETSVSEMLAAGASSYLVKGASPEVILAAVHGSLMGRSVLSDSIAHHVVSELATRLESERRDEHTRRQWDERIRDVLNTGEGLSIVYQPIVSLRTTEVLALEALSRFRSEPVHGPDVWFAHAAALGIGVDLEAAAIAAAIAPLTNIPESLTVGVNVSPEAVLSSRLRSALEAVPPTRLVLEITEHAHIGDYAKLRAALGHYRRAGVRLAIDDAGAGYASFRHILELAPDSIKLDISLTHDIHIRRPQRALAAALVAFARETGATIVAEGIETAEELAVLRDLGVGLGQGYYLRRPEPLPTDPVEMTTASWLSVPRR
jgi:EAL domain-containing protein (putative c-di-GMP-specific phosphodiesterase class I)/AmiR/NasT family two-component response regulator